jgi:hypothetical protein
MHFQCEDLNSKCHFYLEMMAGGRFWKEFKEFQEIGLNKSAPNEGKCRNTG